jgi:probable HAF family extracellular repeat protein
MTLNITIVSPSGIHQSADFRISRTEKDPDGKWIELQPNSSKIVPLRFQQWFGFMTYCGIGLWNGRRTDEYASEWLTDLGPKDPTFLDVVEKLRTSGSNWIGGINRGRDEPFAHSFVVAGFEGGIPIYAIVSNVQSLTERFRGLSAELISDIRATRDLHLLITGIPEAVAEGSQLRLKAVVRSGAAPNVIRHEMAEVNRTASESEEAKNGISPACLAFSIDKHGAGHGEVHGDVPGPVLPRTVSGGIDMSKIMADVLKKIPGAKLVQAAYATTESNRRDLQEQVDCLLEFKNLESYAVEEIGSINRHTLYLQAINEHDSIAGHISSPVGTPFRAFVQIAGHEINNLGTFGGPFSHAFAINDQNQVVGSANVDDQVVHAFFWDESAGLRDLGTLGGIRSVARDVNNSGHVVGASFINSGQPTPEAERAFLWSAQAGMINLGESFESWSRAVAINERGLALGVRQRGAAPCGFVWLPERSVIDIPGLGGRAFYPCAVNNEGLVVGEGDDSLGRRRTFAWTLGEGLKQLGVPDDFHPCDVDANGNVLGNVHSRPWQKVGIYDTTRDRYFELPMAYNHQTSVIAMNSNGVIIGEAGTGSTKHKHSLIFRLVQKNAT